MDEINWNDRLIGIRGPRRIGKTSLLVQYAKERFTSVEKECLYVNLNNFYFTVKTIKDFANEFQMKGGKVLLIDEVFRYPNWDWELAYCYDNFPCLQIVFTDSSVLQLKDEHFPLNNKAVFYNLTGFSFREFLELQTQTAFKTYSLFEIIENHVDIAKIISSEVRPLAFLDDYFHHGFYPFYLEEQNFSENLLKTMNQMLEIDVLSINQIEQSYLPKIRKLFYFLSLTAPESPNISQLSSDIETSRTTVFNYIQYLKEAHLIKLLHPRGECFSKKPVKLYLHNPNLLYATRMIDVEQRTLMETFFYNQVNKDYEVNAGDKNTQFSIAGQYNFNIGDRIRNKFSSDIYYAIGGIESGERNVVPLWLFGFLY
jgi:predicted AAA+ superfamily ATPase